MQRTLLLTAALLAAGVIVLPAQQVSNDANPLNRNFSIRLGGISVPPITGAPFSATAVIEFQQTMPDGSVATYRNINLIGRDSQGRTHGEMRPRMPESFHSVPPISEVHLFDPQTLVSTIYEPATHIARLELMPSPTKDSSPSSTSNPFVKVEDLGSDTIDNIDVKGTRRTQTIPAQVNGTGATLTVIDEYWYSEELHVNLSLRHSDPRIGVQTIKLTNVKREDPEPSFFEVPPDYKIVDMTPPADAPAARHNSAVTASPTP
jgi:hypothetical protein